MKNLVFFDTPERRRALLPLTFTRPAAKLRCGIVTLEEKLTLRAGADCRVSYLTEAPVSFKYGYDMDMAEDATYVLGNLVADDAAYGAISTLEMGEALTSASGQLLAYRGSRKEIDALLRGTLEPQRCGVMAEAVTIDGPQDLFLNNDSQISLDFELLTVGRTSQPLNPTCTLIGDPSKLFIEEGATVLCSTLNVTDGPIYIGRHAEVMEGCSLRGSLALCEHAVTKMGAKIYGATTLGPYCKVGGELGNVVMTGYSNKAHDGYLGNAVLGEWCNLGAGCVSSNLKNDYSLIRLWSYSTCSFQRTKMQFCGLIMGDHSKAGIQTMFNTATVVGIACNIHGAGFPRTFIPSFSFGGASGMQRLRFDKFLTTARTVMARRHVELTEADEQMYRALYELDDYGNPAGDEA